MHWSRASIWLWLLLVGAGCPHDHMRDGFLDRAARKDTREQVEGKHECPPGQTLTRDCEEDVPDEECPMRCQ